MATTKSIFSCVFIVLFSILLTQCRVDDNYFEGDTPQLRYSLDTLTFDTVFTSVGSTTKFLKIFNNEDQRVLIDKISLGDSFSTFFRLNVDGTAVQKEIEEVTILPNDSIYIFVETTIDPDQDISISPFIIENWLQIKTGNKTHQILLEAWGQNANYIPNIQGNSRISYYSCDFGNWEWNDPKPYVVYGSLIVDSCNLIIPAGTKVYFHGGIANNDFGIYNDGLLIIRSGARLMTFGSADDKVEFRTDRLEEEYQDIGGQWAGIILSAGSKNNQLTHTKLFNSIVGIRVDSSSSVTLNQCEIGHNSGNNILASHASVRADNCLFHNANDHGLLFFQGGDYTLNYCTVFNEASQKHALLMNNFRCTDPLCQEEILLNVAQGNFTNCIFTGYNEDEIWLQDITKNQNGLFYSFDHCMFSADELLDVENQPTLFENVTEGLNQQFEDTLFIDFESYDFHLDTFAVAIDMARTIMIDQTDLDGNMRGSMPDLGCYEFQD